MPLAYREHIVELHLSVVVGLQPSCRAGLLSSARTGCWPRPLGLTSLLLELSRGSLRRKEGVARGLETFAVERVPEEDLGRAVGCAAIVHQYSL